MDNIITRRGRKFCIDRSKLSLKANKDEVCNALYGAVYNEFIGANSNPNYARLTNLEKMQKLNEFASNWLKKRGLY